MAVVAAAAGRLGRSTATALSFFAAGRGKHRADERSCYLDALVAQRLGNILWFGAFVSALIGSNRLRLIRTAACRSLRHRIAPSHGYIGIHSKDGHKLTSDYQAVNSRHTGADKLMALRLHVEGQSI